MASGGLSLQFEKRRRIVDLAYETVSDPAKIERFIDELSAIYDKSLAPNSRPDGVAGKEQVLDLIDAEHHFEQAANAFMRLWRQDDFRALDMRGSSDAVLLDKNGKIVSVRIENERVHSFVPGQSIFSVPTDVDTEHALRDSLKKISGVQSGTVFCIVPFYEADGRRTLWALTPAGHEENGAVARLGRAAFDWSQAAGAAIAEAFSLSNSEQDILKTLVQGQSLGELAERRGRSIETVRTQAKSLLTKTGVGSQLDLVRLFAAITLITPELDIPVYGRPDDPTPPGSLMLTLPDKRQMQVDIHGPPTGRPVIFLHNMYSGTIMPEPVLQALQRHGIKLICPWRAGFAKSTARMAAPASPESAFASDLAFLLDTLGIEKTVAVGHMSSAVYAAAVAALSPERVLGAAAVAGFPPFLNRKHIDRLPAWPRLYAYTARYFPKALSLLVRGTFGLLATNRIEVLFDNLFAGEPFDIDVVASTGNRDLFLNDFRRAFEQGTGSYEIDAALAASDWSGWLEKLAPRRMRFIHGVQDPVTPFDLLTDIAGRRPEIELMPIENAGQFVLYQSPDRVVRLIAELSG